MRPDLTPGNQFPDLELADHNGLYPARLFGVDSGFFARNPAFPGPVIQRYQNVPWPGGQFS